jgi:Flp pilus assembly protein TadD
LPGLLAVSIGFCLFIAFEIIAALVWLTSASRTDDGLAPRISSGRVLGINNLLFVSGLYLFNLVLLWLKNTRAIDWNGFLISPFLIYLVSVLLGIWGFRRLIRQQGVFSFRDAGAPLYAGLALLSTLTIGFVFATANDPLVEVFEDVLVYGHLAMGIAFLAYVLFNFLPFYRQGHPIYKVLYQPKRASLVIFRGIGLGVFLGFLGSSNFFTGKQAIAGYYNALGDLYTTTNEPVSAAAFYQLSLGQEYQNHKANYALASLALQNNDLTTAAFFFNQALLKQPSPQAFSGLSNAYQQTNLFFEAIKTLQRGLKTFPKSGELQNNLGYLYSKTSVADSAYFYFASATKNAPQTDVPETNLLALFAKNPQILAADSSLATPTNKSVYASYQANALALKLVAGRDTTRAKRPDWLADKTRADDRIEINVGQFASLYNAALLVQNPDTALANTLRKRAENPLNQAFTDDLLLARAFTEYHTNQPENAFDLFNTLLSGSPGKAALRQTLGLLLLETGLYPKAAETFEGNTDTLSIYYRALALTKAGSLSAAQPLWQTASQSDPVLAALKSVLYAKQPPANDLEKAFYVAYRPDDQNRGRVWETIANPNLKTVSGAALVDGFLKNKQVFYAQMIVSQMGKPNELSPFARSVENISALKIAVAKNNPKAADALAKQPFVAAHLADRARLLAEVYTKTNQLNRARVAWDEARSRAPLDAAIATGTANFYRSQKQAETAYKLALNALNYNPADPELLKIYIRLCLDLSLFTDADEALLQLEFATPRADYQAFLADYQQKIASIEKARAEFSQ